MQKRVQPCRRLALETGQNVRVCVERDADCRMAKVLADDFRMHALRHQEAGVGIPQVMEADMAQARFLEHT